MTVSTVNVEVMRPALSSQPAVGGAERAWTQAAAIAERAGVRVSEIEDGVELRNACALFDELWGTGPADSHLSPGLAKALVHAGNYAAGAYTTDGTLVGAVVGFLGQEGGGSYLHSHILGVSAAKRGANVGFALKQHQRAWALDHGLVKITWTFDPLVRRNAFFNVQKLAADATDYFENFYGKMGDGINKNDDTDRLLADWSLDSPDVDRAADERAPSLDVDQLTDVTVALSADRQVNLDGWGSMLLCATPDDIVALRETDASEALAWRRGLRETLGAALDNGYRVTEFTRSGWYVLERS